MLLTCEGAMQHDLDKLVQGLFPDFTEFDASYLLSYVEHALEQNAKNTAESMRHMGIVPVTKTFKRKNRTFWRVLVGPASAAEEQITLFQKVRTVGLKDAYAITH